MLSMDSKGVQDMGKSKRAYHIRFRCFFGGKRDNYVDHNVTLALADVPKWLEAYHFTHPNVQSVTFKYWPNDEEVQ